MTGLSDSARVLKLTYWAGTHVGFTLRRALNQALDEGRLSPLPAETEAEIGERLSALHTKRAYLPVLIGRVRPGWEPIRTAAQTRDPAEDGYGLDLGHGRSWAFIAD